MFFKSRRKLLTWKHIMSLQNFWLYGMIVGNILITVGTALKIILAVKEVKYGNRLQVSKTIYTI